MAMLSEGIRRASLGQLGEFERAERVRQRGLWVVLGSLFLIQSGFFLIIPLLSIHFVDNLGWEAATIGLVLAVRQFTNRG